MNIHRKIAGASLRDRALVNGAASVPALRASIPSADDHADRVLARVKANAAKLRADMATRIDEEPNHGPLWDDHDIATIRAAAWDGSL